MQKIRTYFIAFSVLVVLSFIGVSFGDIFHYREHNILTSEMTSDIRHPQHIRHARLLVRKNRITGSQCIVKRDGDPSPTQLDSRLNSCVSGIFWDAFAKRNLD